MSPTEFSDDVDPISRNEEVQIVVITLGPAEVRKIVEHELGEPAFRIWLSPEELAEMDQAGIKPDWTAHQLKDGRVAIWRPVSWLKKCDPVLHAKLVSRTLADIVT